MQSSKEKTEPTSASGLGKWAEDGTGACAGERPDGCLPGARAAHGIGSAKRWIVAVAAVATVCFALAGCAPKAAGDESTWSMDVDCGMCHADQQASMEDEALSACTHVQQAQATCTTCHVDEATLSGVHEGATADSTKPKKLKKSDVTPVTCQAAGCHDESPEEHVALTAGVTELTDSNGTMVNPHEVMGLTEGHADIVCADCHAMHSAGSTAAETCVSCHHAGVYECNTCH